MVIGFHTGIKNIGRLSIAEADPDIHTSILLDLRMDGENEGNDRVTGRSNARNPRQFARISDNTFILLRLSPGSRKILLAWKVSLYIAWLSGNSAARKKKTECEFAISISELWIFVSSFFFLQWVHHQVFCLAIVQNAKDTNIRWPPELPHMNMKRCNREVKSSLHTKVKTIRIVNSICRYKCAANLFPWHLPSYTRIHVHFSSP